MSQLGLLRERPSRREISAGCFVELERGWLDPGDADILFEHCQKRLAWDHREFRPGVMMPRLEVVVGEPGLSYSYSGLTYRAKPWTAPIYAIREEVGRRLGASFTACFLNQYRSESDSIGWHSDFEKTLGPRWPDDILIASVSVGATRRFKMRPKALANVVGTEGIEYELGHGDLLVMSGACQQNWEHCLPKESQPCGSRINLTFRVLK